MRTLRRGFTLVELMLAILILAIMMSIIYAVVVSTVEAAHRVEEITSSSEIGPALLTQIRSDIESAFLPKEGEFFVGLDVKMGTGNRDRIDFVSGAMAYGSEVDTEDPRFHSVNEVGYQVIESRTTPGAGTLYRREDIGLDAEPLRGGTLTELYDRVSHFKLRYLDGEKWRDDWNSKTMKNKLPRAVRIELKILAADRGNQLVEQSFTTTLTYPK
jgi:general secretion pathway protein J